MTAASVLPGPMAGQSLELPLLPVRASGQSVTPVFEGWYKNPDGTYSISFGYFNRNSSEVLEVPVGPNNNISPGEPNQGQPSSFQPRRHWGVFAVTVPADFGQKKVTWTLVVRGDTFTIAGHMRPQWEIDALQGEAGSGNTPPVLKFDRGGPEGRGPRGISSPAQRAVVGKPLTVTVWPSDDGAAERSITSEGRSGAPVNLTWFKHQGPGEVTFSERAPKADASGAATTTATFSAPGEYLLRVRANDASGIDNAGHAQCCWTNGFVRVTVTRN
ncbi:MAG: hypothetical protein ACRENU_01690 [Gemmatimonadaceae bacterium]